VAHYKIVRLFSAGLLQRQLLDITAIVNSTMVMDCSECWLRSQIVPNPARRGCRHAGGQCWNKKQSEQFGKTGTKSSKMQAIKLNCILLYLYRSNKQHRFRVGKKSLGVAVLQKKTWVLQQVPVEVWVMSRGKVKE